MKTRRLRDERRAADLKQGGADRRLQAAAVLRQVAFELLLFLPLAYVFAFALSGRATALHALNPAQVAVLYPVCAMAGWLLAGRSGFWRTLAQIAASLGVSAAVSLLLLPASAASGLLACCGFLFALRGRRLRYAHRLAYFQPTVAAAGLFGYFLLPVLVRLLPELQASRTLLSAAGITSLGVFLLKVSRANLLEANQQRKGGVLPSLLWKNRLWAFLLFGFALLLGFIAPIGRFVRQGARSVRELLVRFYLWLLPDEPPRLAPDVPAQPPQPPLLPVPEGSPRHPFWDALERLLGYAVWAALGILAAYLIYLGGRRLPAALAKLKALLARLFGGSEIDEAVSYADEKESLLELSEAPRLLLGRMRDWVGSKLRRKEGWDDLADNGEKVRFLYRYLLRQAGAKGYAVKPELTPIEIGRELAEKSVAQGRAEALAEQYSAVRYGGIAPSADQVDELAKAVFAERIRP